MERAGTPGLAGAMEGGSARALTLALGLLLGLGLPACLPGSGPDGPRVDEPGASGEQTVPFAMAPEEVDGFLRGWLRDFSGPSPEPGTGPLWMLARTPPLPLAWPPDSSTDWVAWVYARAFDPQLADAERISHVWASVETGPGRSEAIVRLVTPQITPLDTPQGVRPLAAEEVDALAGLPEAARQAVALTRPPDAATAAAIRRAYGAWLANHGAIAATLPDAHDPFFAWLRGR